MFMDIITLMQETENKCFEATAFKLWDKRTTFNYRFLWVSDWLKELYASDRISYKDFCEAYNFTYKYLKGVTK